jgi:hypothetical protein
MTAPPGAAPDPLTEVLHTALTDPDVLRPRAVDTVRSALGDDARNGSHAELALAALAALLYSRPDLVPDDLLDPVAELLRVPSPSERLVRRWCGLWEALAASDAAPRAWALLRQLLRDPRLDEAIRARLVPIVGAFVQWREDLVDLDAILALAEAATLAPHRAALLDLGIERFVFLAPEEFTPGRLERLAELFQGLPRYKYVLYALAARPCLPDASREIVARQLGGRFSFHRTAAAILTERPFRLLAVQNATMGQGDDLVRVVPLLQALLDANPALTVTLVAQRTYLYDNPRVTTVAIRDDAGVQAALRESYEGVIEFFQPEWAMLNCRAPLSPQLRGARPPAFVVQGDMGRAATDRAEKRSQFLHQRVELGGRDIAGPLGLDRPAFPSSYDPGHRLLAELGLPQRAAEEPPRTLPLLTGIRSADAERAWSALLPAGDGPVALVSPFGGSAPTKGFLRQDALLAAELEGLVSEGYRVVVLPQHGQWARPAAIDAALVHLGPAVRARIAIAPDPDDPDAATRLQLTERPDLPPDDRVMRLVKYFAGYADVIVTVEGWLAHLAYLLGRPFRLLVAAGSFTSDWFPHGRGPAQRLVPAMSARARAAHFRSALLGPDDPPPVPHFPRRVLLQVALAGVAQSGRAEAATMLRRALPTPDRGAREWIIAALGALDPIGSKADLIRALGDGWPGVVREAAAALLRAEVDCRRELGPGYRILLQAYVDGASQNWDAVTRVGPSALPVLFQLGRAEHFDVSWGARQALRPMLSRWIPGLRDPGTLWTERTPARPEGGPPAPRGLDIEPGQGSPGP